MSLPAPINLEIGSEVHGRPYTFLLERMLAFSGGPFSLSNWPLRNLHTDPAKAAEAGLDAPIASGLQYEAHVIKLLRDTFGEIWSRSGVLTVKYVHPVRAGDVVRTRIKVVAVEADLCQMEVRCEKADGALALIGEATCPIER
jgi:hypothetical protein